MLYLQVYIKTQQGNKSRGHARSIIITTDTVKSLTFHLLYLMYVLLTHLYVKTRRWLAITVAPVILLLQQKDGGRKFSSCRAAREQL